MDAKEYQKLEAGDMSEDEELREENRRLREAYNAAVNYINKMPEKELFPDEIKAYKRYLKAKKALEKMK